MWTQVIGKIRLAQTPWTNHSWHVPLYVTARGLSTSPIPHRAGTFQMDFDFVDHRLLVDTIDGDRRAVMLQPRTVADFYHEVLAALAEVGREVRIRSTPTEVVPAIPFESDTEHHAYDPEHARSLWLALVQVDRVFKTFRASFLGKCSPVHFFWGSFDLAVTRFSGRPAPPHPGGIPNLPDWITREAYSHEVSSAGFWPGSADSPDPIFYSYAYPEPEGYADAPVRPDAAGYLDALHEFVLPYEAVRRAADPDAALLTFLYSTYDAAADRGGWDRAALECELPPQH